MRRRWQGCMYSASFTPQAKGVLLLIHNSIPFRVMKVNNEKLNLIFMLQTMTI